jgi:hypothetical protein
LTSRRLARDPRVALLTMPWLNNLILIERQRPFIETTVREILFDGYSVTFLINLKRQLAMFGVNIEIQDTFGFFLNVCTIHIKILIIQ